MGEASIRLQSVPAAEGRVPDPGKTVAKSHLVNRLNYLNFQEQTVLVSLRHLLYDSAENAIFLRAQPLPCAGERLDLVWAEIPGLRELLKTHRFDYLLIPDGKKYLLVNSEVIAMDESGLSLILPVTCHEFQARSIKRHAAAGVNVQIVQHAALLAGELVDFTPVSLRVTGGPVPPATFEWFNPETNLNVRLLKDGTVIYSGAFELIWQGSNEKSGSMVLRQVHNNIRRFKNKRYRNMRQELVPSPNIVFEHPVVGKRVNLKVADLSGTGFAVEESESESVLMAGMILPDVSITFAQGFSVNCTVQVVSRTPGSPGENAVRCGVAILDMDIRDHVKLLSMLHQVANMRSYVGTEVDMDDLWDFFFETGFIYPGKYAHFQANKEEIKRTYARLYGGSPQIARHFIYQDRGAILGHLAMVRFYDNSWLIHHHAARKSVTIKAGLAVLDQVGQYLNELENYTFAHLRYVYCYYRPDNKFPHRVFGGFAKGRNRQVCSEDRFAYSHHHGATEERALPEGWELVRSSNFDLNELGSFYRYTSGGLLVRAFDLQPGKAEQDEVSAEYRALGFRKEKYCYSLRREGALKAFILVNCTDAGFNMADLTNCVTLLLLDDGVPRELVELALDRVSAHYEGHEMPVLTYPLSYAEKQSLAYDKIYTLWILDLKYSDDYFQYCDMMFKSMKRVTLATVER
jgi:hypothetical protein